MHNDIAKGNNATGFLVISHDVIPKSIEKGKNLLVNLTLGNEGKSVIRKLNIDLVSTGFKASDQQELTNDIYPNSTILSQYVLEPTNTGKHTIYLDWTYTTSSENSNSSLASQVSNISNIGTVDVAEPAFYAMGPSLLWPGIITSLIGLIAGAGITKLGEWFRERDIKQKENRDNLRKVKSMLLADLKSHEISIDQQSTLDETSVLVVLVELKVKGLYQYLAKNKELEGLVQEYYGMLRDIRSGEEGYQRAKLQERKDELTEMIGKIRGQLDKWES